MADTGATGGGADDWCTIESDPGVFTEMLEKIGCQGIELEEMYSLDDDSLKRLCEQTNNKVYGLIFLFKWISENQKEHAEKNKKKTDEQAKNDGGDSAAAAAATDDELFFAHQTTTNACATQAILSVILNIPSSSTDTDSSSATDIGTTLSDLKSFTSSFPPNLKGVAISSSEEIRTAHNSFSRHDAFLSEGKFHIPTDKDEAFHFVAYVPHSNTVYELDGLQQNPLNVGTFEKDDNDNDNDGSTSTIPNWLVAARDAIQERMNAGGDHIKFNLMAVIQDKRIALQEKIDVDPSAAAMYSAQLEHEIEKRQQWKLENQRRKHNYVPLCVQLLKELAAKGTLEELIQDAKDRQVERQIKMQQKK